jgi:hypothetical protein|tara:strand:+ start:1095 stop:1424 length:330 start_codon:yes stop_codon:yes gene_type:complete
LVFPHCLGRFVDFDPDRNVVFHCVFELADAVQNSRMIPAQDPPDFAVAQAMRSLSQEIHGQLPRLDYRLAPVPGKYIPMLNVVDVSGNTNRDALPIRHWLKPRYRFNFF